MWRGFVRADVCRCNPNLNYCLVGIWSSGYIGLLINMINSWIPQASIGFSALNKYLSLQKMHHIQVTVITFSSYRFIIIIWTLPPPAVDMLYDLRCTGSIWAVDLLGHFASSHWGKAVLRGCRLDLASLRDLGGATRILIEVSWNFGTHLFKVSFCMAFEKVAKRSAKKLVLPVGRFFFFFSAVVFCCLTSWIRWNLRRWSEFDLR